MVNKDSDDLSSILVGEYLTEVDFVMDYLRLRFDHCSLTIIADAVLRTPAGELKQNSGEFCVELINCNGQKVENASIQKGEFLKVDFHNGYEFFVSMDPEAYEKYKLAEAVTLNHDDGRWWV